MNTIIIANGEFPSHPKVLQRLRDAQQLVCCDGAIEKLLHADCYQQLRHLPLVVVGDGDSYHHEALGNFEYVHDADQETNDLTKAVHYCITKGWRQVTIVGATGLREDHTLGNISLLATYQPMLEQVEMLTDHGVFTPMEGYKKFDSFARQQVSLLSLTPKVPVTVAGLQYPIDHRPLHQLWEGTLNAALGDSFEIEGGKLVVFQTYEAKQ